MCVQTHAYMLYYSEIIVKSKLVHSEMLDVRRDCAVNHTFKMSERVKYSQLE